VRRRFSARTSFAPSGSCDGPNKVDCPSNEATQTDGALQDFMKSVSILLALLDGETLGLAWTPASGRVLPFPSLYENLYTGRAWTSRSTGSVPLLTTCERFRRPRAAVRALSCAACSRASSPPTGSQWRPWVPASKKSGFMRRGAHRVLYVARFEEAVYVLHGFEKKTRRAPKREIEAARSRLRELLALRRGK
jgi:hypothetical protein